MNLRAQDPFGNLTSTSERPGRHFTLQMSRYTVCARCAAIKSEIPDRLGTGCWRVSTISIDAAEAADTSSPLYKTGHNCCYTPFDGC